MLLQDALKICKVYVCSKISLAPKSALHNSTLHSLVCRYSKGVKVLLHPRVYINQKMAHYWQFAHFS